MVQAKLQTRVRDDLGSNLYRDTVYSEVLRGFSQLVLGSVAMVLKIRKFPLLAISLHIQYSLLIKTSKLLRAKLNRLQIYTFSIVGKSVLSFIINLSYVKWQHFWLERSNLNKTSRIDRQLDRISPFSRTRTEKEKVFISMSLIVLRK